MISSADVFMRRKRTSCSPRLSPLWAYPATEAFGEAFDADPNRSSFQAGTDTWASVASAHPPATNSAPPCSAVKAVYLCVTDSVPTAAR
jgi:hypothetical protein